MSSLRCNFFLLKSRIFWNYFSCLPEIFFRESFFSIFTFIRTLVFPYHSIFFTCVSYAEACNRYRLDVRPSVCLSVTRWYWIKTAEYIVMLSSPHDSPFILVLCISRSSRNSDWVTPCGGAKYRFGIKIARFSTNKSLYLANDTRYRHGCYGRRIGTHTRSIKWCHFQWPWMNPNPVFKVKLLNGISFNDLERHLSQFSRSRYYSTSNNSQIVQDRAIVTMAD